MNDVGVSVDTILGAIDAAAGAGLDPVKIDMVVKRGVNEEQHRPHGPPLPGHRPHPALHRVHGRRQQQRLAHGRRRPGAGDRRRRRRRVAGRAGGAELLRRGRRALALPRRRGRDRRHRLGDAALLRHAAPAPASRPRASSTPASSPGTGTTCGRPCGSGAPDEEIGALIGAACGAGATRPLLGDPHGRADAPGSTERKKVEMSHIGG